MSSVCVGHHSPAPKNHQCISGWGHQPLAGHVAGQNRPPHLTWYTNKQAHTDTSMNSLTWRHAEKMNAVHTLPIHTLYSQVQAPMPKEGQSAPKHRRWSLSLFSALTEHFLIVITHTRRNLSNICTHTLMEAYRQVIKLAASRFACDSLYLLSHNYHTHMRSAPSQLSSLSCPVDDLHSVTSSSTSWLFS